jgi:hypothetical protein
VRAFLKRRWILLVAVCALLGFGCVDWGVCFQETKKDRRLIYVEDGNIWLVLEAVGRFGDSGDEETRITEFHSLNLGSKPEVIWHYPMKFARIPLWLPLCTFLGWLVFRELRWREKRAKTAESCGTN